jgi:hypothetical protein
MTIRLLRWLVIALCLALSLLQFALLLADQYGQYSAEILRENHDAKVAAQAAASGISLAPYIPALHESLALALIADGQVETGLIRHREALRLAPADAQLWAEYSESLAYTGHFGPELEQAQHNALSLGPESARVNWQIALLGARYWNRGNTAQQADWARAMLKTLDEYPARFQYTLVNIGRASAVCVYAGAELGLARWCEYAQWLMTACQQADLPPAAQRACGKFGIQGFSNAP